jgi:hypothetical protein
MQMVVRRDTCGFPVPTEHARLQEDCSKKVVVVANLMHPVFVPV